MKRDQYKGIVKWFSNEDDYIAVILKDKNQLIGFINKSRINDKEFNFGYVFHSEYSGKGYAYEAGKMVIDYIFNNLSADLIKTGTPEENIPSQRLLGRLGFLKTESGEFSLNKEKWLSS